MEYYKNLSKFFHTKMKKKKLKSVNWKTCLWMIYYMVCALYDDPKKAIKL